MRTRTTEPGRTSKPKRPLVKTACSCPNRNRTSWFIGGDRHYTRGLFLSIGHQLSGCFNQHFDEELFFGSAKAGGGSDCQTSGNHWINDYGILVPGFRGYRILDLVSKLAQHRVLVTKLPWLVTNGLWTGRMGDWGSFLLGLACAGAYFCLKMCASHNFLVSIVSRVRREKVIHNNLVDVVDVVDWVDAVDRVDWVDRGGPGGLDGLGGSWWT